RQAHQDQAFAGLAYTAADRLRQQTEVAVANELRALVTLRIIDIFGRGCSPEEMVLSSI
ncbi:unnamed protein product, partial [Amoebophrya sp. A25]